MVSNEDVPTVGSGYGICSCHSTTGIHQNTCNEFNDSNGKILYYIINKYIFIYNLTRLWITYIMKE